MGEKMSYDNIKAIRSSDLDYLETNPYLYSLGIRPTIESKAVSLGSLVHTLTLEPQDFDNRYAIEPEFNKRTKKGKEDYTKFLEENQDKEVITKDFYDKALKLSENARAIIGLFSGDVEKEFVADYNDKIKIKAKPDVITSNHILIDLKTISNIDLSNDFLVAKALKDRKYHRQLGFYKLVLYKLGIEVKEALFVFVDTTNYWVRGVKLKEIDLQTGMDMAVEILDKYDEILRNGLKVSNLFKEIELPNWYN